LVASQANAVSAIALPEPGMALKPTSKVPGFCTFRDATANIRRLSVEIQHRGQNWHNLSGTLMTRPGMMRQLLAVWILIAGVLAGSPAMASDEALLAKAAFPVTLKGQSPPLERKNQAILTYLWADVYAAAFYAEPSISASQAFSTQTPQRLSLYYLRDIDRTDVIKAAETSLKRQQSPETLARLGPELARLHKSFQDIKAGDRYQLSWDQQDGLTLLHNGNVIFASPDAELAKTYFALWLAPDGLSDTLRKALLK
jgi:hypothetical protein